MAKTAEVKKHKILEVFDKNRVIQARYITVNQEDSFEATYLAHTININKDEDGFFATVIDTTAENFATIVEGGFTHYGGYETIDDVIKECLKNILS